MSLKKSVTVILGLVVLVVPLAAQTRATPCTLATLKGSYGALEEGTFLGAPYIAAAITTYDGAGHFSGTAFANIGGTPLPGTFTGTYTVDSDCTVSEEMTTIFGISRSTGAIAGQGIFREIHYMYTDVGTSASGTAWKISPSGCTMATMKGNYAVYGHGTVTESVPGLPEPPFAALHAGVFTADGAGHFTGHDTLSIAGAPVPDTFTGKYTELNRDCTVSIEITTVSGLVVHEWGTITGNGNFQQFHAIITDPGWIFAEAGKKQ